MELLYFISGILSVGVTYGIILLRKNQNNYHDALARLQHHQNISSIRNSDVEEKIGDMKILVSDIQANMEKDQYENLTNINDKIRHISGLVDSNINSHRVVEEEFKNVKNEIHSIKMNIKALNDDPNFLSRYS
jgi:septal ring factor EnvC (AmiA/AmiB activator)